MSIQTEWAAEMTTFYGPLAARVKDDLDSDTAFLKLVLYKVELPKANREKDPERRRQMQSLVFKAIANSRKRCRQHAAQLTKLTATDTPTTRS